MFHTTCDSNSNFIEAVILTVILIRKLIRNCDSDCNRETVSNCDGQTRQTSCGLACVLFITPSSVDSALQIVRNLSLSINDFDLVRL